MDKVTQALSTQSQLTASQRACKEAFLTRSGWVDQGRHPYPSKESEKITITWRTDPMDMCVKGKDKKMAVIVSPVLHNVFSLSGWADNHPHLPIIDSHLWTSGVRNEAARMKIQLPQSSWDNVYRDGWDGRYHASHAEAKLMALYVDFHTNQPEALQYLASISHWNSRVLDIDVSSAVCMGCRELARSIYEKHSIMVNFTVQGNIEHPHCKNFYCNQQMSDGLRVFCNDCQIKIDHLSTVCVDLPQMDATQFGKLLQESAKQNGTFGEDEDIIYDILKAISTIPVLGLHLYHEGAVSRSSLTVILPILGNADLDDTIDACLENVLKENNSEDRTLLIGSARKAIVGLIDNLAIPGIRQAFGNFDSSPWQKPMPSSRKCASSRGTSPTAVHDLLHDFNRLSVYNRDWIRSRNYFDSDSDDSSGSINCFLEGDPGWSDTDDEVEEANAADDGIKIMEGDW